MKRKWIIYVLLLLPCLGCGYHFSPGGENIDATDDALALASGLMNLAANQVMHRIPGIKEKIEAIVQEADVKLH